MTAPRPVTDPADLDAACAESPAVIYKHSTRCGASLAALHHVRRFMEAEPGVPVYMVDVVRDRAVAMEVERRLGVRHESPQVIVVVAGEAVWDASHRDVTASALTSALHPHR